MLRDLETAASDMENSILISARNYGLGFEVQCLRFEIDPQTLNLSPSSSFNNKLKFEALQN